MANEEHLRRLEQGLDEWNEWRGSNPEIKPDLSQAQLNNRCLKNFNLFKTNLNDSYLNMVILDNSSLLEASLCNAYLRDASLKNAQLRKADFSSANLYRSDLNHAQLQDSILHKVDLSGANLIETNLTRADLSYADLRGAKLQKSKLISANLFGADLRGADLSEADLENASLLEVDLRQANINNTNLSRSQMGWTLLDRIDLSTAIGLSTVRHFGPSSLGVDAIVYSQGDIDEAFLRGCGVPEIFSQYIKSLATATTPIKYHSLFISYSSKDDEFVQRLHTDLRASNIQCWYAREDMRIGSKIRAEIDSAIHIYDKLLLVLSKHSIQSDWVEDEVEAALAKEREQKRTVLFPVRLDDEVLNFSEGWPAKVRRQRNIGDFTNWTYHDSYQRSLDRLLRDLILDDNSIERS